MARRSSNKKLAFIITLAFVSITITALGVALSHTAMLSVSYPDGRTGNGSNIPDSGDYDSVYQALSLVTDNVSLSDLNFTTYTYGGCPVQQPDFTHFRFLFPNSTRQGLMAGSDSISLSAYPMQRMDFDATFTDPSTNAAGFDEMVVFAASNTVSYNGTEFGIRLSLADGFIYGYIQEPDGSGVNFQMTKLMYDDGMMHHYTMIALGSRVSFYIDGVPCGYLNFPTPVDYSSLTFSVCTVVHRFTDGWSSGGDSMTAGNFSIG